MDKGGGGRARHNIRQASKHQHRACSLQSAVCALRSALCTLHSAACSLSVVCSRCGVSRIAASSSSRSSSSPCLPASLCAWSLVRSVLFSSRSYSYSTYGVNMRPKPCHVRRIGHPCHPKTTVVRCACSSVDLQTTKGGARNPQALGVQVASSLSCFTAAVDPAAHQTTQLQSSSRPSPSLMGFPNAATHAGSGQRRAL